MVFDKNTDRARLHSVAPIDSCIGERGYIVGFSPGSVDIQQSCLGLWSVDMIAAFVLQPAAAQSICRCGAARDQHQTELD